ncbi:hypothetical protein OS493_028403 [Desmophyllum pertusum]|uniref:Uncharacterized protein n=1 Tax=Desmophyllum pertusum TaxID=174260 RepID=A0A9X0D814_9CNID|nr:hypothetical protein OS493_028403 [Desmophyllum pertusum]
MYGKLRYETDLAQNKSWKLRYEDLHIQNPSGTEEVHSPRLGLPAFMREKRAPLAVHQITVTVQFHIN